jgi:hypothetical protein
MFYICRGKSRSLGESGTDMWV